MGKQKFLKEYENIARYLEYMTVSKAAVSVRHERISNVMCNENLPSDVKVTILKRMVFDILSSKGDCYFSDTEYDLYVKFWNALNNEEVKE